MREFFWSDFFYIFSWFIPLYSTCVQLTINVSTFHNSCFFPICGCLYLKVQSSDLMTGHYRKLIMTKNDRLFKEYIFVMQDAEFIFVTRNLNCL